MEPTVEERLFLVESLVANQAEKIMQIVDNLQLHLKQNEGMEARLDVQYEKTQAGLDSLHEKIDKVLNVRVNGSVGLEQALQTIYKITAPQRSTIELKKSIRDWCSKHKLIGALVNSKYFVKTTIALTLWVVLSSLQVLGVDINVWDILRKMSKVLFPG
jgi:hypothetical protein